MPRQVGRWILASTAFAVAMALLGTSAVAVGAVDSPAVPAPGPTSQVAVAVPQVSAPSVPALPAVPSVPSVPSAPAVPSPPPVASGPAPVRSVPRVSAAAPTQSIPRAGGTDAGGGSGGGGAQSGTSGSQSAAQQPQSPTAAPPGSSTAGGGDRRSKAVRERAQSRRLRAEVRRFRGCLGALPALERRYLGLRAGLAAPALSQHAAAQRLGISAARAQSLESRGLSSLREAVRTGGCGGAASGGAQMSSPAVGSVRMPTPAAGTLSQHPSELFAASASGAPTQAGTTPPAAQGYPGSVQGSFESPSASPPPPPPAVPGKRVTLRAASPSAFARSGSTGIALALAVLALVTGTLLVRRRAARVATGAASAAPAAAATVAPAAIAPLAIAPARAASAPTATGGSEADAEAQAQAPERPHAQAAIPGRGRDPVGVVPTPAERAAQRPGNRLARPAAVAASGLVPLVVRRLLRKRGRSGRRRR